MLTLGEKNSEIFTQRKPKWARLTALFRNLGVFPCHIIVNGKGQHFVLKYDSSQHGDSG